MLKWFVLLVLCAGCMIPQPRYMELKQDGQVDRTSPEWQWALAYLYYHTIQRSIANGTDPFLVEQKKRFERWDK